MSISTAIPSMLDTNGSFSSPGSAVDPDVEIVETTLAAACEAGIDADRTGFNMVSDARFLNPGGHPDAPVRSRKRRRRRSHCRGVGIHR